MNESLAMFLHPQFADVFAHEARMQAAVDRARAKGALRPCPDCRREGWHDSPCMFCPAGWGEPERYWKKENGRWVHRQTDDE